MKHYFWGGLTAAALMLVGYAVWADSSNDTAALTAAREKRTASLRQVANDRTSIKTACSKKGTPGTCQAAQAQYKSDLAVYHSDQSAFRAAKQQQTAAAYPSAPTHPLNAAPPRAGSSHSSASSHH